MHPRVPMTATHHQSSLGWKVEVWSETSSYQRLIGFFRCLYMIRICFEP
jgi:hypothetical protein